MVWRCCEFFFPKIIVFFIFFDQIFFDFYVLGSFLYFKELIVAKNYKKKIPRLAAAPLSAETRRLSAEMKIPSAEVDKSQASALSGGATKRGSLGPIGRGYLFEVHRISWNRFLEIFRGIYF